MAEVALTPFPTNNSPLVHAGMLSETTADWQILRHGELRSMQRSHRPVKTGKMPVQSTCTACSRARRAVNSPVRRAAGQNRVQTACARSSRDLRKLQSTCATMQRTCARFRALARGVFSIRVARRVLARAVRAPAQDLADLRKMEPACAASR
jgi:hypothetical protein